MKKKYFIHHPLFRLLAPVVYGVIVYLLILLINNNLAQLNEIFIGHEVYICIGLTFLSFESIRITILLVEKYLPETWRSSAIPVQVIGSSAISLGLIVLGLSQYFNWVVGFSISTSQLLMFGLIYTFTALLYNILYYSNYYLNRENTLKLQAERQQQEVLEMEITEFKNDINPDLLYESLESTIGLMYHNTEKAEEYIDCLASTYRYMLTNRHKEFVPVADELEAGRDVIRLLNERHNGQLKLQVNEDVTMQQLVLIPGSLPIALETLVRNTIINSREPFVITCYIEDGEYLVLQSKLNDKLLVHDHSLQAFFRLQKSYALYSDKPMIQVKAYEENYIKFPVVRIVEEVA